MNHVYKLIWSRALQALVPVPEVIRTVGRGGRMLTRRAQRRLAARGLMAAAGALPLSLVLCPASALALPQGGQVVSGQVSLAQNGSTLNVNQSSSKAIIDWQKFNVGANETVNFKQPGASSVVLNRVIGNDPTQIFGHLTANGQIFLVNPDGVYFAPNASVNVGGLVASTLGISNQNFLAGNYHFSGLATASVVNYAQIRTFNGGYVAFIGRVVDNEGKIITPGSNVDLGAGGAVDLTLASDRLVSFRVSTAALNAAVKNGGAIIAQNGAVLLTARAKEALLQTVVNNTGLIQANGATTKGGMVTLLGGASGTVADSGTIQANSSVAGGGTITVTGNNVAVSGTATITARGATGGGRVAIGGGVHGGGNIPQAVTTSVATGAVIDASATATGAGGTVSVWSNVANPASSTRVSGTILAKGANGGAGGFVETSGHNLSVTGAVVNTGGGTWLLDPYNVTIASSNASGTAFSATYTPTQASTILNTSIETALASGNVTITTTGTGGGSNGNITVDAPITWSANNSLTLDAAGNIAVNAPISASGSTPSLVLDYGQSSPNGAGATLTFAAPVSLPAGQTLTEKLGSTGTQHTFTVITAFSNLSSVNGSGDYALGASITATGSNFTPIGSSANKFTGIFEGLGNTISDLKIKGGSNVGLFGVVGTNGVVRDVGLVNDSVSGSGSLVGGLVGYNFKGTITNAYATGSVTGGSFVGGLVGGNSNGTITNAYATGSVSGSSRVGGLVGSNSNGTITNAYATGSVSGSSLYVGGLVGDNFKGTITNAYATGSVSGSSNYVGGLVGGNSNGTITNAYATDKVTGKNDVGGLVGGNSNGTITNAYATGSVSGKSSVGGLVGSNSNATITNGYWDTTTSRISTGIGAGTLTGATGVTSFSELAALVGVAFSSTDWSSANGQVTPYLVANETFGTVSGEVYLASATGSTPTLYGVIASQTQLQNITSTGLSGDYVLGSDITATGSNFTPIGSFANKFTGIFEGLGNTISDLKIKGGGNVGLFGVVGTNGVVRDVGLVNDSVSGSLGVGGLVGANSNGTITNAYATGSVSGSSYVGGLVGGNTGIVSNAYATGSVSGSGGGVGGLVGFSNKGKITNAYATGSVLGGSFVGGLVGYNLGGTVTNAYATGSVSGSAGDVGGLVGGNIGIVSNAYATGSVLGGSFVGGLVGFNSNGTLTNAYATGSVSGSSNSVGGLAGASIGTITNAYATGSVSGKSSVGGLVGSNNGTITNGYWDTTTSRISTGIGAGTLTGAIGVTSFGALAGLVGGAFSSTDWSSANGQVTPYLVANETFGTVSGEVYLASATGSSPTLYGVISSQTQLQNITSTGLSGDYVLGSDITATGSNFTPIGSSTNNFTGIFEGLGNTISDLNIKGGSNVGLFSQLTSHGVIRDLGLLNETVSGSGNTVGGLVGHNSNGTITNAYATGSVSGKSSVGGLVGYGYHGTITNAYATGSVSGSTNVGGLVGSNNGTITNAYATGSVTTSVSAGTNAVGGLVGGNSGLVSNAYATGSVSGSVNAVGGLVGFNTGTITNAYATGSVAGRGFIGGLVGYGYQGTITNDYATGSVSGSGGSIGGLVGYGVGGTITNDYATGSVSGSTGSIGGLVGYRAGGTITNAYATGSVSGTNAVGGLVGGNSGLVSNAYATGSVSGKSSVGGLVGSNSNKGTITNGYWDTTTSGTKTGVGSGGSNGATGLSTIEWLTQGPIAKSVFSTNTWVAGYPYPVLKALPYVLVTAKNVQATYGSNQPGFTLSGAVNQNGSTVSVGSPSFFSVPVATASVGTYAIGGSGATVVAGEQVTYDGSFTINKLALTITPTAQSSTYGTTPVLNPADYSETGLVNGDSISSVVLSTTATSKSDVGSYGITASGAQGSGLSNYTISYAPAPQALTISPAALTITPTAQSSTYGTTPVLNPADYSETGLVSANGDSISSVVLSTTATSKSDVGSYGITASGAQGSGLSNYTISYAPAPQALTIDPAALTITPTAQSSTYGTTPVLNPADYSETGLVNGDSISSVVLSTTAASESGVGSYGITASGAQGPGMSNYTISYKPGLLTVNPATLTITGLFGTNKIYDGSVADPLSETPVLHGLVGSQTLTLLDATLGTLSSSAVGIQSVTTSIRLADGTGPDGGLASNYTVVQPVLPTVLVFSSNVIGSISIMNTNISNEIGNSSSGMKLPSVSGGGISSAPGSSSPSDNKIDSKNHKDHSKDSENKKFYDNKIVRKQKEHFIKIGNIDLFIMNGGVNRPVISSNIVQN